MKTVMIVDDSRFMREDLCHCLEGSQYHVSACCRDAEEALDSYQQEPVDVVLMDIVLPGMDGIEATPKLVEMGAKVVIISALDYDDAIETAQKSGAAGFLTKPFHPDALLEELGKVCCGQ